MIEIGNIDNNWRESEGVFHRFVNKSELLDYLNRPEKIWDAEKGRYDFEQCHFDFDMTSFQWGNEFEANAIFVKARFQNNVSFKGKTFKGVADFTACNVANNIDFSEVTFKREFRGGEFKGKVNFHKAKFYEVSEIWGGKFYREVDFSHCHFFKGVDFSDIIFENKVSFNNTTFEDNVFFFDAEFKGKVNAWNLTCNRNITFKWANFRNKATFSTLNVKNGKTDFYGSNFEGNAYFYDSNIKELDLNKSVIDKGVFFLDAKIDNANRETYRIIKHEFLKQNNKIESLKYYALEMQEYKNELFGKKKYSRFSVFRFFQDFYIVFKQGNRIDKFIIFLNQISNNHNTNPIRSFLFTFSIMLIFYFGAMWFTENNQFDINSIKSFFQFINPTHKIDDICVAHPTKGFYIMDFLGRLFISYGIYQFIQAFRKFGKK